MLGSWARLVKARLSKARARIFMNEPRLGKARARKKQARAGSKLVKIGLVPPLIETTCQMPLDELMQYCMHANKAILGDMMIGLERARDFRRIRCTYSAKL